MRAKASVRIAIATVILVTGISGRVAAAPITFANPSFEIEVVADGSISNTASGWTRGTFGSAPGAATWNPSGVFTGDSGNGTPQGAHGINVFTIYGGNSSSGGWLTQDTTTPLTADTTYTLTIAVGRRSNGDGGSWGIDLMTTSQTIGAAYLARLTGTYADLTSGQFVDKVVTFTPPAGHPNLGQNLRVYFWSQGIDETHTSTAFDNVRLDATADPQGTVMSIK